MRRTSPAGDKYALRLRGAEPLWPNGCSARSAVHLDHMLCLAAAAAQEHRPWRYQSHQLPHPNPHLSSFFFTVEALEPDEQTASTPPPPALLHLPLSQSLSLLALILKGVQKKKRCCYFSTAAAAAANQGPL